MPILLKKYSLHQIPRDDQTPSQESIPEASEVEAFLHNLLVFLESERSVRKFLFDNERAPEAKTMISSLPVTDKFKPSSEVLATRLHAKQREKEVGAIRVQAGDLLTLHYEKEGATFLLLAKLEQVGYLNRTTWKRDAGFPDEENRPLKTCLCEASLEGDEWLIGEVTIYDSSSRFSEFWWRDFLELREMTDDAKNSNRAFNAWKDLFEKHVRPISKIDCNILINDVGCFFKNSNPYNHKEVVSRILDNYIPESPDLDLAALKKKADKLPQQSQSRDKRFDEKFNVDPKACNVRRRPIHLTPEVDLVLRAPIAHLKDVVQPATIKGKRGVFVASDSGFSEFSST